MDVDLDLGAGHLLSWAEWEPDPEINPQYADLPPERFHYGAVISHVRSSGGHCAGVIVFDSERSRRGVDRPRWTVESSNPLTLSPSVLCSCGDHGFIRDGRWVQV